MPAIRDGVYVIKGYELCFFNLTEVIYDINLILILKT